MTQAKNMNVTPRKHRHFPFIVYHVTKIQWRPLCNRSYLVGQDKGHIRLSVSTASRTYELSEDTHVTHFVRTDFIGLGFVTTDRKNGLTEDQLAVVTDSRSVSTGPSRMFSILTEGCHVGDSREFVGTVCCTYGQSNTTNVTAVM